MVGNKGKCDTCAHIDKTGRNLILRAQNSFVIFGSLWRTVRPGSTTVRELRSRVDLSVHESCCPSQQSLETTRSKKLLMSGPWRLLMSNFNHKTRVRSGEKANIFSAWKVANKLFRNEKIFSDFGLNYSITTSVIRRLENSCDTSTLHSDAHGGN